MFAGFAHVWTPIAERRNVKQGATLRVMLAGEPIVLWRDGTGSISAFHDRCPHRGVALSLGRVLPNGCLECPFHGWQFDPSGACKKVPLAPEAKRERLSARAFPVRELGPYVWLYTAPVLDAPSEPNVPEALLDEAFSLSVIEKRWNCHWTRMMENMLDSPHIPFVHQRSIGRALRKRMKENSFAEVSFLPTATGAELTFTLDDGRVKGARLEFIKPNGVVLHVPSKKRRLRINIHAVPRDEHFSSLYITGAWDFSRYNPLVRYLITRANHFIVDEDKAIVESSQPREVPEPAQELSVATDKCTLQFRRYYYAELKHSSANVAANEEGMSP